MDKLLTNPIFVRLTRSARPHPLRATLWLLALGLWLVILALISLAILLGEASVTRWILTSLHGAAIILMVVSPVLISIIAANLTTREVGRETFQLLRMTDISRDAIVHGFVLTALYRARLLLALLVAMLPIVIVQHVLTNQAAVPKYDCYVFVVRLVPPANFRYADAIAYLRPPLNQQCVGPSDARLILSALLSLPGVLAGWGMSLFGAAIGVDQGLVWRRTSPAVIFASLITLMVWVLFPLTDQIAGFQNTRWCASAGCVFLDNLLNPLGFDLVLAAIVYAAGVNTVNDAKSRVWGRPTARQQ